MKFPLQVSVTAFLLILYWAVVLNISRFAPLELAVFMFSEEGVFERYSPFLWFFLAAVCLFGRFRRPTRAATVLAAVLCGCREMDLHKSLFGLSFLKTDFYRSAAILPSQKIMGLCLIAGLLALAAYLLKTFAVSYRQAGKPRNPAYAYVWLALALLCASKFIDRLNAQLKELFHIALADRTAVLIQSLEESTEMILPVLLCIAVWCYRARPSGQPR